MEENQLFDERYQLIRLLGRGNFSEVWLAKDSKTHIEVALKVYAPATGLDNAGLDVFAREFSLVVNANHKNLLKPLYYDTCDRKPYLVLPFCKRGSILSQIGMFDEKQAWHLLHDVAAGLDCLHKLNPPIIHQDIKPDNVMIADDGTFMITDFGVSSHVRASLRKSMSLAFASAGTIAYMAPERFGKDNSPVMASDIYSLGATVYEMLDGDTPFGDDGGLMHKRGAEIPNIKADVSELLSQTIEKCLSLNPWDRPTAEQLEQIAADALAQIKKQEQAQAKQPEVPQKRKTVLTVLPETPDTPEKPEIPEPPVTPVVPPQPAPQTPPQPAQAPLAPEMPQASETTQIASEKPQTPQPPPPHAPGFQEPPKAVKEAQAKQTQSDKKKKGGLNPWIIAAIAGAFVIIGVVAGLLFLGGDKSKPEIITPAGSTVENTDGQSTGDAGVLTAKADSLVNVGDQHGEEFEDAYIDAYKNYKQANAAEPSDELTRKMGELETKLNKRYDELKAKADELKRLGAAEAAEAKYKKADAIKELIKK